MKKKELQKKIEEEKQKYIDQQEEINTLARKTLIESIAKMKHENNEMKKNKLAFIVVPFNKYKELENKKTEMESEIYDLEFKLNRLRSERDDIKNLMNYEFDTMNRYLHYRVCKEFRNKALIKQYTKILIEDETTNE